MHVFEPGSGDLVSWPNGSCGAKQREGKKRMKALGQVEIPQKAFLAVLEAEEDK